MSTDTPQPAKQANPLLFIPGLLGAVVGYYCGLMILIPFAGAAVGLLLGKHLASTAPQKPFVVALAVIFGHLTWMLVGVLVVHAVAPIIADLIIIIAGLLWLLLRPGLGPVILLGIYEIISVVVNGIAILQQDFGTVGHKALTAHIALRLFAVGALIAGYRQFRKNQISTNPANLVRESGQTPEAGADVD